jgi:hypothetical protein
MSPASGSTNIYLDIGEIGRKFVVFFTLKMETADPTELWYISPDYMASYLPTEYVISAES